MSNCIRVFFRTACMVCLPLLLHGQGEPIHLANPSFEDAPQPGKAPKGWYDCGNPMESPPDIHPNGTPFEVNKPPFEGISYMGLVVRDNDTWEAVGQRLSRPIEKDNCYTFSLVLSRSDTYVSLSRVTNQKVNYTTPAKIRIWGGMGYCDKRELLAESTPVNHSQWQRYDFKLRPKQNMNFIMIESYYVQPTTFPYNGNILIDNASDIVPYNCNQPLAINKPKEKPKPNPPANKQDTSKPNDAVTTAPPKKTTPQPPRKIIAELDKDRIRTGQIIRVEQIQFLADSTNLKVESYPVLDEIYRFLQDNPKVSLEIGGHTNGIPPPDFCDRLSTERAKSVANYLVGKGITSERLQYKGYGKRKPIAPNTSPEGRRKNQRVEIKILTTG